jgi:hypothetical protein
MSDISLSHVSESSDTILLFKKYPLEQIRKIAKNIVVVQLKMCSITKLYMLIIIPIIICNHFVIVLASNIPTDD